MDKERARATEEATQARRTLYFTEINLAEQATARSNPGHALRLLEKQIPTETEAKDFRGWEWHYLWNQLRSDAAFELGQHETEIRSIAIYGGVGAGTQIEALHRGVEIVVACPGRLLDHIQNNHAKLGNVEVLVLDEADRMLDMGFLPDIKRILKHVPQKRQTMLFSATFPKEIERLAAQTLRKPS